MNTGVWAVVKRVHEADKKYGAPRSTLGDRISGRVLRQEAIKWTTLVSDKRQWVSFVELHKYVHAGHGRTHEVIAIVQLDTCGSNRMVFLGWSSLSVNTQKTPLSTPATLCIAQASASEICISDNYFNELESTLTENDTLNSPCLIKNRDTFSPFSTKSMKGPFPKKAMRTLPTCPVV